MAGASSADAPARPVVVINFLRVVNLSSFFQAALRIRSGCLEFHQNVIFPLKYKKLSGKKIACLLKFHFFARQLLRVGLASKGLESLVKIQKLRV